MSVITISNGQAVSLRFVDLSPLGIEQVAHSLSQINRFTGHASRPISVAEHSLMVCEIMERHFQVRSPFVLLAGLMHDAHECLTGDVSSPLKEELGTVWAVLEERIQRHVLRHFRLITAFTTSRLVIKDADLHALTCEREQLMPAGDVWPCQITHPAIDWVRYPAANEFTAEEWSLAFLARYEELDFARQLQVESIFKD